MRRGCVVFDRLSEQEAEMDPDELAEHQARTTTPHGRPTRVLKPSQKLQENNSYVDEVVRKGDAEAAAEAVKYRRKCRRGGGRPGREFENQ